jgi:diguanylate cyclase (GGDEF)-like protein
MQALLVRVLQDVVKADVGNDVPDSSLLVEANEKLVLAALAHQAQAETATRALEVAEKAARLDALTGLPNRATLMDRFSQAIAGARRRGSLSAVLFLDLDDFKSLNDAHGHPFGDKALQLAAERMLAVVREMDTVSRYGGDEFLILLPELSQIADARKVADKLLASIAAPAQIDGIAVNLTASFPTMGKTPSTSSRKQMLRCTHRSANAQQASRSRVIMQCRAPHRMPRTPPASGLQSRGATRTCVTRTRS